MRLGIERWVAAREYEPQPIVAEYRLIRLVNLREHIALRGGELTIEDFFPKKHFAAYAVDRLVAPRTDQPRPRIVRHSLRRPLFDRSRKGVLLRFLGQIEIAEQTDQSREDPTRLPAKDFFDIAGSARAHAANGRRRLQPVSGQIGRTSMLPIRAPGMRAAMAVASSRFLASIR